MPRLLVDKGPDRGKSITVEVGGQVVVGRDPNADLQLSDQMASRRHFLIASRNGVFGMKDLNSANGTLLNGRQAEGARRLKSGDSIQVGETLMSWLPEGQTDTQGGLVGQEVAGYRVEERIGRGAMGTVFKATQLSLGRTVALKVLAQDLVRDEKFCEMFLKEARAAGGLNHPNIIQVYDVGEQDDTYYFSMEYASRGSVQEELSRRKSIKIPRAVRIIKDACAALEYAERKGLVHRDIKPDNLMVTEDETVKLGDLGLAMSAQELQAEQDGVFGTPHYIAPEQAMGKQIDHRADIYALGATFYRMLTGRTMFQGTTVKEILKKQVREPHPPVTQHLHDCPKAIAAIIDRMLAKDPAERYQHAGDIIADLQNWEMLAARQGTLDGEAFARGPRRLSPEDSQLLADFARRRKLMFAGVVALVCVLAAVVTTYFVLFGGSRETASNKPDRESESTAGGPDENEEDSAEELSPETIEANEKLQNALWLADFQVNPESAPGESAYQNAIDGLDKALEDWPDASESSKQRVRDRRDEIATALKEMRDAAAVADSDWQKTRREALEMIEDFKTRAAGEIVQAFIDERSASPQEGVQQIVGKARTWLEETYPTRCSDRIQKFENDIQRKREAARQLPPAEQVEAVRGLRNRARAAAEASDDATYDSRLKEHADKLGDYLEAVRREARAAERQEVQDALARAGESLEGVLEACREDIARGDFANVATRLETWKEDNEDFRRFDEHPSFRPVRRAIERRREETSLQHRALVRLALPRMSTQNEILRDRPWPDSVQDFLGGERRLLIFQCDDEISESQWKLDVRSGQGLERQVEPAELDADGRRSLCEAIAHLVRNYEPTRDAMREESGEIPAMAGLYAWMADMGASEAGRPLIEELYESTSADDPSYALVREYYARALLGKARAAEEGERAEIHRVLREEFEDTRAAREIE